MTPFAAKIRQIRKARGISQKEMAAAIGVTPAYLSALEHGHRSPPNWVMVQKIIGFLNIIWDEADELQRLAKQSNPRVVIDTSGLSPKATALANQLSQRIGELSEDDLARLSEVIEEMLSRKKAW
ncbi:transcriptional regulator [Nitratireductor aestuarii]|uniref:Transcriptional regulator n=1 Tax=Nitratireductor aestuarii TaxID=1735103 RepID=A0A916W0X5_9HYPH|nr:helix-turn-helix domain-containing protein [Nitratireductor aestuarii]GGA57218.1 transcriptional regulator [Nitratireductor aestuarii]